MDDLEHLDRALEHVRRIEDMIGNPPAAKPQWEVAVEAADSLATALPTKDLQVLAFRIKMAAAYLRDAQPGDEPAWRASNLRGLVTRLRSQLA